MPRLFVLAVSAVVGLMLTVPSVAVAVAGSRSLEHRLLKAVRSVRFDQVIDFGPVEDACPGAAFCGNVIGQIMHVPNVDVAIIELDRHGRAQRAADVLLSRDHPQGVVVPLDHNWGTTAVRFRRWDIDRWNGGTFTSDGTRKSVKGWHDDPPLTSNDDIAAGRTTAPLEFMAPYPASLFKLMVAFHVLRLVDRGEFDLNSQYAYDSGGACDHAAPAVQTNARWLEEMITISSNRATCALLKQLHQLGKIGSLNTEMRQLGLATLQINGTSAQTGGTWQPGQIHMTALDTARLLWLINGAPGVLWHVPDGTPVTKRMLSESSRTLLINLLAQQAFNEVLSTANWCGAEYPAKGIPQLVPKRWMDARDGTVTVDGKRYGRDVRPCNLAAQVTFAHKTGLTYNYGSDAGIVTSLPGKPRRHYIVAFLSNLGYRYSDARFATTRRLPCFGPGICYTEKIAKLGRLIDSMMTHKPRAR